jgi:TPR repeat protein
MYLEGRGTERDLCKARVWLTKAATHPYQPLPEANRDLARINDTAACNGN